MSAQYAIEPEVRPVDRGLPRVGERRERAPRQPFPGQPERDANKRKPASPDPQVERDTPDAEHHIDICV